jgi:hypothetical protein
VTHDAATPPVQAAHVLAMQLAAAAGVPDTDVRMSNTGEQVQQRMFVSRTCVSSGVAATGGKEVVQNLCSHAAVVLPVLTLQL